MTIDLTLREAGNDDMTMVWELNSEPSVRAQSLHSEPIPWVGHVSWFQARLSDRSCVMLMVGLGQQIVGVVRFQTEPEIATISIALSSRVRGRGLGRKVIAKASDELFRRCAANVIVAHIRSTNSASIRAFEAAGYVFRKQEKHDEINVLRYEYCRTDDRKGDTHFSGG